MRKIILLEHVSLDGFAAGRRSCDVDRVAVDANALEDRCDEADVPRLVIHDQHAVSALQHDRLLLEGL